MTDASECWAVKSSDKSAKTLRRFKPLHTLAPHSTIVIDMRKAPLTGDIETVIDVFPSEATSGQEDPVLEPVCDEGDDNRYKRAADRARRVATSFASQVTEKDSPNGIALDILRRILFHKDQADYRQSSPTEQKADLMQGIRYLTLVALRHEAACQSREGSGGSKEPVFAVRNNTTPPCSDADWHDSAGRLNRIWLGSDADKTKYANMSDLLKLELGQEAAAVGKRHIGHGPRGQAEAPKDFRPRW